MRMGSETWSTIAFVGRPRGVLRTEAAGRTFGLLFRPMGKGYVHPRAASVCALLTSAVAALLLSAAPARAAFQCEASAARGTVLGAATVEPITANKGQAACRSARGGGAAVLPAP